MLKTSHHLNAIELNQLLNYLYKTKNWAYYIYVKLSVHTAVRFRDLSKITWSQALNNRVLVIQESKTQKIREIPLCNELRNELNGLYEDLAKPGMNTPIVALNIRTINKQIKVHAYKAGIRNKRISTHSWRKTFGREVWRRNNYSESSIVKLSHLFNHSSTAITRIYLDITKEEVNELYDIHGFMI